MSWLLKRWWILLLVIGIVMLAPISAAAMTNGEVIAVLAKSIDGLVELAKLAYCASGVAALCPS